MLLALSGIRRWLFCPNLTTPSPASIPLNVDRRALDSFQFSRLSPTQTQGSSQLSCEKRPYHSTGGETEAWRRHRVPCSFTVALWTLPGPSACPGPAIVPPPGLPAACTSPIPLTLPCTAAATTSSSPLDQRPKAIMPWCSWLFQNPFPGVCSPEWQSHEELCDERVSWSNSLGKVAPLSLPSQFAKFNDATPPCTIFCFMISLFNTPFWNIL